MESELHLRPIERRVLRLAGEGVGDEVIAARFRRSPEMIRRLITIAGLPRSPADGTVRHDVLRPLERRVLRWREAGAGYEDIGPRFHRSPAFVQRVESLAHYKLARA